MTAKVAFITIEYTDGSEARMEFSSDDGSVSGLSQSGTSYTPADNGTRQTLEEGRVRDQLENRITEAVTDLNLWPKEAPAMTD